MYTYKKITSVMQNILNKNQCLFSGEQKTKPTQNSVRELRCLGLWPDLVMCRSHSKLTKTVTEKLSLFCDVKEDQVGYLWLPTHCGMSLFLDFIPTDSKIRMYSWT